MITMSKTVQHLIDLLQQESNLVLLNDIRLVT